jgi:outer membrane lipoprotein LolB
MQAPALNRHEPAVSVLRRRFLVLLVGVLQLGACTTLPPPAARPGPAALQRGSLRAFYLVGRFSVHHQGKNHVGGLRWHHDDERDELLLSSPLGQGMAEIISDATGARLTTSDGGAQTAASADELLQSALAAPISLRQLLDWLRGRNPDSGTTALDELGRPLSQRHEDWRIAYEYDSDDPQALPGRLFVEREDGFVLRLRIDEWQPLPPADLTQ